MLGLVATVGKSLVRACRWCEESARRNRLFTTAQTPRPILGDGWRAPAPRIALGYAVGASGTVRRLRVSRRTPQWNPISSAGKRESHGAPDPTQESALEVAAPPAPAAGETATGEAVTAKLPAADAANGQPTTTELEPSLTPSAREQCPICGAAVAPDQRYCVECGQRLAQARPPLMSEGLQRTAIAPTRPPRKPRFQTSPSGALIGGIATLLIAMGIGVYVGSLTKRSSLTPVARQIVTVPNTGATGAGTTAQSQSLTNGQAKAARPGATSGAAAANAASSKPTQTASKPPNPTVHLGQKGSGPGYQHHKFTGHFFGAENEEDAGQEGEEESSSTAKGGKGGKK
jgi:hypothetical protein